MRRILFFSGLLLVLAACKSKMQPVADRYIIEDLAEIATVEKIDEIYPDARPTGGTDFFEEGTVQRAYNILYPESEDEVLLTWKDRNRTRLHHVRVQKDGRWKSETGIRVGMTYDELVALNQAPISFYGFGWDYGGAVDWNGGKLEDSNIQIFLAPREEPDNKFLGDHIIEASDEEIVELDLKVSSIIYRRPNNFMSFSY